MPGMIDKPKSQPLTREERVKALESVMARLDAQNFGPKDSVIASTINHPVEGFKKGLEWLTQQMAIANSPYVPSYQQAEAATNLAGLAQLGSFPMAPKSAGGTLGTMTKYGAPDTELSPAHETARKNAVNMLGLPENNTAMDRARAMGFDVDNLLHHGTSSEFDEFNRSYGGTYTTNDSGFADTFNRSPVGKVHDLYIRPGKQFDARYKSLDEAGKKYLQDVTKNRFDSEDIANISEKLGRDFDPYESLTDGELWLDTDRKQQDNVVKDILKNYDSLKFQDNPGYGEDAISTVIKDPKNIRSRFAAFDPAKKDSANILASLLLPATALVYGMTPNQQGTQQQLKKVK